MKAPLWGMCCAVVCSAILGMAVALHVTGQLRAADPINLSAVGPDVSPLARPSDGPANSLNYPNPMRRPVASPQATGEPGIIAAPQAAALPTEWAAAQPNVGARVATEQSVSPATNTLRWSQATPSAAVPVSTIRAVGMSGAAAPVVAAPVMAPLGAAATAVAMPAVAPTGGVPTIQAAIASNTGISAGDPRQVLQQIDSASEPMTADPLRGAPTNIDAAAATAGGSATENSGENATESNAATKFNPWRPIQTAFRQIADSKSTKQAKSTASTDATTAKGTANAPANSAADSTAQPMRSVLANASSSSSTATATSGEASAEPAPYARPLMPYDGPTDVMNMGGGCNCGGPGSCGQLPPGQAGCPNCGGWMPGTCSTHNPEGSCILERMACCLCKPYPDCSNGCVDFCHSWIFHEDDCWCTSNHKCCAPWCGPYPYGGCAIDGQGKGVGCGCGNCGPCVPPPDLYFTLEAFAIDRDNDSVPQTVLNDDGGAPVLNTGDFNFGWETGPRFLLGYRPTRRDAWEISYFGLHDWDDPQTFTSLVPAGFALPGALGTDAGLNFGGGAEFPSIVDVNYASMIHDAELNYIWRGHCEWKWLTWLAGFRYFHLDEEFDISSTVVGTGTSVYNVRTDNDLFGGQLGMRMRHCCKRLNYEGVVKAGAFGNSAVNKQFVGNEGGIIVRDSYYADSNWAFVGEAGATVSYYICKSWCVSAGYNVIYVDGVALAPNQLDFTNNAATSGLSLNNDSTLLLHGGRVGIGCRW